MKTMLTSKIFLVLANAAVWSLCYMMSGRLELRARAGLLIDLETYPAAVLITLDGKPYGDGKYVQTPVKLAVAAGKHRVVIARDGFIAVSSLVSAAPGETVNMRNLILERDIAQEFIEVEVDKDESVSGKINASLNDGFLQGELPLRGDDFLRTKPVYAAFTVDGGKKTIGCQLRPAILGEEVLKVRILKNNNKWRIQGCQPSKPTTPAR